jgi:hypothetical protein
MTTENRKGHAARNGSVAAVIVILMALLVFPGFLAAGLSKGKGHVVMFVIGSYSSLSPGGIKGPFYGVFLCRGRFNAALRMLFLPAEKLSRVSEPVLDFYAWQYEHAGGEWYRF